MWLQWAGHSIATMARPISTRPHPFGRYMIYSIRFCVIFAAYIVKQLRFPCCLVWLTRCDSQYKRDSTARWLAQPDESEVLHCPQKGSTVYYLYVLGLKNYFEILFVFFYFPIVFRIV